jgi:hypothetical protein
LDLLGGDAGRRWRRRAGGRRRHGHLLLHRRGIRQNRWVRASYLVFSSLAFQGFSSRGILQQLLNNFVLSYSENGKAMG